MGLKKLAQNLVTQKIKLKMDIWPGTRFNLSECHLNSFWSFPVSVASSNLVAADLASADFQLVVYRHVGISVGLFFFML